ncbi:PRC-barrel domain-containing protein [Nakamurella flavida]|uniref:PRC-barrel domain-containing protein n=1 Tax=Nakamurella flavida TaxID=363630 RepID=A0A939C484_9ACTN|nr:PRC-barrel domain-containing protein [Nakamurella flavida]MBM9477841.1 PRC-barrel domain-containing protein [Nakamurella flavida]MDP9779395.1 sporulation protein YlmC with PRC-barrel domain [Nakamurella flavida]
MLFSDTKSHKVVATDSAETVGKVAEFVVDPAEHRIIALGLSKTPGDGNILPWSSIKGFGADAVTVTQADTLVVPDAQVTALSGKNKVLLKKRVLDTTGLGRGSVRDVEFDGTTGVITSLVLDAESIPGDRLVGIGSYAVIVQA